MGKFDSIITLSQKYSTNPGNLYNDVIRVLCKGILEDKLIQIKDQTLLNDINKIRKLKNSKKINTKNKVYTASQQFLSTVVTSPVTTYNVLYTNAGKPDGKNESTYNITDDVPIFICNNNERLNISLTDDDSLINDDCTVYNFGKLKTVKVEQAKTFINLHDGNGKYILFVSSQDKSKYVTRYQKSTNVNCSVETITNDEGLIINAGTIKTLQHIENDNDSRTINFGYIGQAKISGGYLLNYNFINTLEISTDSDINVANIGIIGTLTINSGDNTTFMQGFQEPTSVTNNAYNILADTISGYYMHEKTDWIPVYEIKKEYNIDEYEFNEKASIQKCELKFGTVNTYTGTIKDIEIDSTDDNETEYINTLNVYPGSFVKNIKFISTDKPVDDAQEKFDILPGHVNVYPHAWVGDIDLTNPGIVNIETAHVSGTITYNVEMETADKIQDGYDKTISIINNSTVSALVLSASTQFFGKLTYAAIGETYGSYSDFSEKYKSGTSEFAERLEKIQEKLDEYVNESSFNINIENNKDILNNSNIGIHNIISNNFIYTFQNCHFKIDNSKIELLAGFLNVTLDDSDVDTIVLYGGTIIINDNCNIKNLMVLEGSVTNNGTITNLLIPNIDVASKLTKNAGIDYTYSNNTNTDTKPAASRRFINETGRITNVTNLSPDSPPNQKIYYKQKNLAFSIINQRSLLSTDGRIQNIDINVSGGNTNDKIQIINSGDIKKITSASNIIEIINQGEIGEIENADKCSIQLNSGTQLSNIKINNAIITLNDATWYKTFQGLDNIIKNLMSITLNIGFVALEIIINGLTTYGENFSTVLDKVYKKYFGFNGNTLLKEMHPDEKNAKYYILTGLSWVLNKLGVTLEVPSKSPGQPEQDFSDRLERFFAMEIGEIARIIPYSLIYIYNGTIDKLIKFKWSDLIKGDTYKEFFGNLANTLQTEPVIEDVTAFNTSIHNIGGTVEDTTLSGISEILLLNDNAKLKNIKINNSNLRNQPISNYANITSLSGEIYNLTSENNNGNKIFATPLFIQTSGGTFENVNISGKLLLNLNNITLNNCHFTNIGNALFAPLATDTNKKPISIQESHKTKYNGQTSAYVYYAPTEYYEKVLSGTEFKLDISENNLYSCDGTILQIASNKNLSGIPILNMHNCKFNSINIENAKVKLWNGNKIDNLTIKGTATDPAGLAFCSKSNSSEQQIENIFNNIILSGNVNFDTSGSSKIGFTNLTIYGITGEQAQTYCSGGINLTNILDSTNTTIEMHNLHYTGYYHIILPSSYIQQIMLDNFNIEHLTIRKYRF